MNEQALKQMLEGIVRNVVAEMHGPGPAVSVCPGAGEAIPVELSARHAHLSEQDALTLFGAPLTPVRELSQPGQFLCKERVRLIGPKGVMDNVAVLGPSRGVSQVEISKTDARVLGAQRTVAVVNLGGGGDSGCLGMLNPGQVGAETDRQQCRPRR